MRSPVFHSLPEVMTYSILILMLVLNVVGLTISASNAQQAKILAAQAKVLAAQNQKLDADAQKATVVARQQNIERQEQLKSYIKCIVLIRYDHTPESLTTREGVESALDGCAQEQG
jgi:hypothetical protein